MAPIAETDYANPAFDVSNPLWPAQRVGTLQTYLSGSQPSLEWVPILNPVPMRGLNEVYGPEPQGGGLPGPGVEGAWTLPNRADNELDSSQDRIIGVSGLILEAHESLEDMPFTHPFGKGYTFDLAPDERWAQFWAHHPCTGPFTGGHPDRVRAARGRWRTPVNAVQQCWESVLGATPQEFESPILRHVELRRHDHLAAARLT